MSTYDDIMFKPSLSIAARTNGTVNGTAVDRVVSGGTEDAVLVVFTGALTDGAHAITVEDSADGSTGWAAVSGAQMQGSLPTTAATDDDKVFEVGVANTRRFLRAVATTSGATTGGVLGAGFILGRPRFKPITRP